MDTSTHEEALEWIDAMEIGFNLSGLNEVDQPEDKEE